MNPTRRRFLSQCGAAAASTIALPGALFARGANERFTIGLIGAGGQGRFLLRRFLETQRVDCAAIADVYEGSLRQARAMVEGPCELYRDFRKLLERRDLDAVVIGTPDHWHALTTVHSCQAGKDVYCEKPLSLTIREGRTMVDAVRDYGRVFQTGSQQRSSANFRQACELVRSGKIGKVQRVEVGLWTAPTQAPVEDAEVLRGLDWDFWLGPAPLRPFNSKRHGFTFRWFWDYSGGMMTDWGAHHLDIAQWGLGRDHTGPVEVEGEATWDPGSMYETPTNYEVRYRYADGLPMVCGSDIEHGVRFIGEDGWVHVLRGSIDANPKELLELELDSSDVRLHRTKSHYDDFLDSVVSRQRPICDVEIGHRSVTLCHLGNLAMRLGRKLRWDPEHERFLGDEGAAREMYRPYRAAWMS